jgi:mannose-6-phosphate isomerase-like protein (cupin superfamily)
MVVGDDEFPIQGGDAFYIPLGAFHVTYNMGIDPLKILWVTGRLEKK